MNILVCNDDGIHAPGLAALVDCVKDLGTVHVVAPAAEQSAVGHAITIASPIKAKQVFKQGDFYGFAVGGTPADCVKLAVSELLPSPPDLVLSGINHGPNAGISVLYSGTVSGATEGTILGIPSIAFSINTFQTPIWETAARVARIVVERFEGIGIPPDSLLNVNIPSCPYDDLEGFAVVPIGKSRYVEEFHARVDPRGNTYYWMDGELELFDTVEETDVQMLRRGYVTLTPIHFDLTNYAALETLRAWDISL